MKIRYILICITGLLFATCSEPDNEPIEYKFEVFNNSPVDIKIIAYERSGTVKNIITIGSGNTFNKSFFSQPSDRGYFYSDALGGDSIKIIYNHQKKELFYCYRNDNNSGCNKQRNILSLFNDLDEDNRIILNRYVFTEEDYQNAIPCEGECE